MGDLNHKYEPGKGPYVVRYGLLPYQLIPESFVLAQHVYTKHEKEMQFYSRLEESVVKEGFRNPVLIWVKSGPDGLTVPYGGSRVYTASKLKIPVPAIVCDWTDKFKDWRELRTVDEVKELFTDLPQLIEFRPECFHFWGCSQTHLDKVHKDSFHNLQLKNNLSHMNKRSMNEGQFWYSDDLMEAWAQWQRNSRK